MKRFLMAWGLSLICFAALDAVWLTLTAKTLYAAQMGNLMRADTVWGPAVAFYLLLAAGLVRLVILPRLTLGAHRSLGLDAVIFGLCAYGTYDLTAWAVIRDWPWTLSLIDMAWGTFANLVTAYLVTFLLKFIKTGD
jgi:uncharacterized membrane protein